jgi:hypothetical protein
MSFLTFLLAVLIFLVIGNIMYVIINPRNRSDNKFSNSLSLVITGFLMYQFNQYELLDSLYFLISSNLFIIVGSILVILQLKKNKK